MQAISSIMNLRITALHTLRVAQTWGKIANSTLYWIWPKCRVIEMAYSSVQQSG